MISVPLKNCGWYLCLPTYYPKSVVSYSIGGQASVNSCDLSFFLLLAEAHTLQLIDFFLQFSESLFDLLPHLHISFFIADEVDESGFISMLVLMDFFL